ncbi:hypothetical protein DSO57_1037802 [Entomophthora muscae]|uniref:Uncharacterized protein n=1 Tax=Entomophthora muscae TaxID=34485 RepID=A0ACC2RPV1_9FUNG|nr:hypothetical protein DSO57_1037802 [Entomophthora muscae]
MAKEASYYAVYAGNKPGVYTTWAQCQEQTKGFTSARYKKFNNQAEAEAFVKSGKALGNVKDVVIKKTKKDTQASKQAAAAKGTPKAIEDSKTDVQSQEDDSEKVDVPSKEGSTEIIYTSGTSRGRGKRGVCAGLGVYFGEDSCNISERLPGPLQNNRRAELMAGIRALEKAPVGKAIEIHTTSIYLVQGVTKWISGWVKKGWLTAKGTEVENRDLFETLDTLVKQREPKPQWVHIADKAGDSGIEKANELAIAGTNLEVSE